MPSLLHGAGTWTDISKATETKLNQTQNWFVRLVLKIGPGAPLPALSWDFAVLDMVLRIWIEKLMLVLHILMLEDESIAKQVYNEQRTNYWRRQSSPIFLKVFGPDRPAGHLNLW